MLKRDLVDPLKDWADQLDRMQWSALITDADWNLKWVSRTLRGFLRVDDDTDLGYGQNFARVWTTYDEWLRTATPESQVALFFEVAPFFARNMLERGLDVGELLGEPFSSLIDEVRPAATVPLVWSSSFEYRDPRDPELPTYRVNFCAIRINDDAAVPVGMLLIFFIDVNPNLMSLLVRGDQQMHERMARLVDPQPQEAAVLFCDLHESGRLSRELSSAVYFKMVRRLWTGIDAAIAAERGIVGKHAGDGASAFFLATDLGSPSRAAAAAIQAARAIHEISRQVFRETVDSECLMKVGLHWGGSLYMGQLVPGGRLDVTALGDEVNETARVQESASPGTTLVTKQLLERLGVGDGAVPGIDLESARFKVLSDLPSATDKARRDAGGLAVSFIE
ncbi:MAG: adenylate/guanylate cyclase domain-containing protein [Actinomycetota bacterium]